MYNTSDFEAHLGNIIPQTLRLMPGVDNTSDFEAHLGCIIPQTLRLTWGV